MSDVLVYGVFDAAGVPGGFYPDDIYPPKEDGTRNDKIPAAAVEISRADWQALLESPLARYVGGQVTYVEPPPAPPPEPAPGTTLLYDHENRLRAIEGQPPLSLADFAEKAKSK